MNINFRLKPTEKIEINEFRRFFLFFLRPSGPVNLDKKTKRLDVYSDLKHALVFSIISNQVLLRDSYP